MSLTNISLSRSRSSQALAYGAAPRVNLLPPAEREQRDRAALVRRWATVAAGAAVLVVLASLVAALLAHSAQSGLRSEQSRTAQLAGEVAGYHDVSAATGDKSSYEAFRTQAMADDVTWKSAIGALQAALPRGAAITGFDAVVGAGGQSDGSGAAGGAGSTGAALTAAAPDGTAVTVTVQVGSKQPLDQRAVVSSFGRVPGVLGVDLGSLSSDPGANYTSTTAVFFDDSVLSRRYAKAAAR